MTVLLVGGLGYYILTRPPRVQAQLTPVPTSPQAAQSLDTKLQDFQREMSAAAASGQARPVQLVFTEAEVNSGVAQALSQAQLPPNLPLTIKDIQLNLQEGRVLVTGNIVFSGIPLKLGGEVRLGVTEGKPTVSIDRLDLGGMPIPASYKAQLVEAMTQGLRELEASLPLELKDIQVKPGQLIVDGLTRPQRPTQ